MPLHVLVVDDEPAIQQILSATLSSSGYQVSTAGTARDAAAYLVRGDVDIALCDIRLPDGSGLDLVRQAKQSAMDTGFIMVTAFGSTETAVEALRAGASDFITKPVRSEELLHRLAQVAQMRGLREENRALRKAVNEAQRPMFEFRSPPMQAVTRLVTKVAPTDSTVLISGESGTGKGITARRIHELSPRADGAFVSVNCGAIPETLLESEFFGHTKGAFTHADRQRKGLFVQADGGTLFLDEIGELPLAMQTKLLHVIEEKSVRPLGSEQARRVNVRIIAATNRDLPGMVKDGRFREDLYFRLGVFHILVPPLRERREDIRPLIHHLMQRTVADGVGIRALEIDASAEDILVNYSWPGNVRELENVIHRAHLLADGGRITIADLPAELTPHAGNGAAAASIGSGSASLREMLKRYEYDLIMRALREASGDRRVAAQTLGIGLSSLYRKIDEIGLSFPAPNE